MSITTDFNYSQVIAMTDEEKLEMYMKCTKKELAKMLIESNRNLDMAIARQPFAVYPSYPIYPPYDPNAPIVTYDTSDTNESYNLGLLKE